MIRTRLTAMLLAAAALAAAPAQLAAQRPTSRSAVQVTAGGGFLTSGTYFAGPGSLALDNGNAFAGLVQVIVPVYRSLAITVAGAYARPEFRLTGVPLVGSVGVDGASLWFADVGLRGELPLGRAGAGPRVFAQAGAGLAHYSLSTAVLGQAVDGSATNLAVTLGAGVDIPLAGRVGLELMAKDYIASFESVRDLASFGIEGRRAHTVLLTASARVGL